MQDQGTQRWYDANNLLSNASNHDTNGAKFKDWRLPTKRELNLMWLKSTAINDTAAANGGSAFGTSWYWSSTEGGNEVAWLQSFSTGTQNGDINKVNTFYVRAVRAF